MLLTPAQFIHTWSTKCTLSECVPNGLVCWSLTSLCHSNGHMETMPAREINPFTALTRIRSQFLRTQWSTSNQRVNKTTHQTAQPSGLACVPKGKLNKPRPSSLLVSLIDETRRHLRWSRVALHPWIAWTSERNTCNHFLFYNLYNVQIT